MTVDDGDGDGGGGGGGGGSGVRGRWWSWSAERIVCAAASPTLLVQRAREGKESTAGRADDDDDDDDDVATCPVRNKCTHSYHYSLIFLYYKNENTLHRSSVKSKIWSKLIFFIYISFAHSQMDLLSSRFVFRLLSP